MTFITWHATKSLPGVSSRVKRYGQQWFANQTVEFPVHPVHKLTKFRLLVRKMGAAETDEKIGKMLDLLGFMAYPASNQ